MKRLRCDALPLVVACMPFLGCAAGTADKAARIDRLMSQYADYRGFSGTVLISDHDQVIFKKGYGLANREWNIPNTPEVKFRLG